jgi:hypothetical protein
MIRFRPETRGHWFLCAAVATLAIAGFGSVAGAQVQTSAQRKCFSTMAAAVTRVDTTQARENRKCVGDYGFGKLTTMTVTQCQTADRRGRMARLEARIDAQQLDICSGAAEPDFGYVVAADMIAGVAAPQADFLAAVLGTPPEPVVVDRTGGGNRDEAICQNSVLRSADKVVAGALRAFAICGKNGVRRGADPFDSAADLEGCIDDAKVETKVGRAVQALQSKLASRCAARGIDYTTVVAGACAAEPTAGDYVDCLAESAVCHACQATNAGYDLGIDCDLVDNGASDSSCTASSPTGAFVDGPMLY